MKTFHLEVMTPEKTVFDGDVKSLIAPAEGGLLGVLPGHAPLLTSVEVGECRADLPDGGTVFFFVGNGFLEVEHDHARLLCDVAERGDEIDEARARAAEARARERLKRRSDADLDIARAELALRKATIRQKIIRDLKGSGTFHHRSTG